MLLRLALLPRLLACAVLALTLLATSAAMVSPATAAALGHDCEHVTNGHSHAEDAQHDAASHSGCSVAACCFYVPAAGPQPQLLIGVAVSYPGFGSLLPLQQPATLERPPKSLQTVHVNV